MSGSRRPIRTPPPARWWATAQTIPPALAGTVLARPRLERRLSDAAARRLTVIVAGAGAGKSTLLATWAGPRRAAWYALADTDRELGHLARGLLESLALRVPALPGAVAGLLDQALGPEAAGDERARARACAGLLASAIAEHANRGLVLILDDLQEIGADDPGAWLVEALVRQAPEALRIVIASRTPLPFSVERLHGQGRMTTFGGSSLAFDPTEVEAVARLQLDGDLLDLAARLHAATGGWPAAVHLALEALADVPADTRAATLDRLLRPTGPVFDYLADEVLAREPAGVRALLAVVARLPRFSAELATTLGVADAPGVIRSLDARGLFLRAIGDGGWYVLHPLMREHVTSWPTTGDRDAAHVAAAAWFEARGEWRDSILCRRLAGDRAAIARVLEVHGPELLDRGDVQTVLDGTADLPPELRTPVIDRLEGQARQVRGDWEGALACFRRLATRARPLDPGIAWRMGLIHHLRGELGLALETYRRARIGSRAAPRDVALLHAWLAAALWLRGDHDACRAEAAAALGAATASEDDQALAAAHTTAAMVAALDGDRRANDAHYLRALDHAVRAGDVLQQIRIRANRGSRLVEEGYYDDALDELRDGIALAEIAGFAAFHALALSNRGETLRRLGRFEEAIADLEASRAIYQRLESRLVSYPLAHLGDVHAERGAFAVAMASFEEAIAVAEVAQDVQGLRPALAGLAELLAPREPDRARDLAERAVGFGPGIGLVRALLARGRVDLLDPAGRRAAAALTAREAAAEARARRDRAGLAEALELEAEASAAASPADALRLLDEALVVWHDLRAPVAAARVECRRAEVSGAAPADDALEVLRRAGAAAHRHPVPAAGPIAAVGDGSPVAIRTLGGFEVLRDDGPVPTAAWGSRKARDLLKILICRRDRHVPRDQLLELLWPDDPAGAGRRLSAMISTVRGVLDPAHRLPADWFIAADRAAVWLDRAHVAIDVDAFLEDAAAGLDLAAGGDPLAAEALRRAEAAHRGEFLIEDVYEDWSAALRETCRQVYASVAHRLADLATAEGDHAAAARYRRRVIEHDEYDERAHLGLVANLAAGGLPADARRAYATYLARMEDLGVEAAPFPG